MTSKSDRPKSNSGKTTSPPAAKEQGAESRKRSTARRVEAAVPIEAADERRAAQGDPPIDVPRPKRGKGAAHRASFAAERQERIPGERGGEEQPYLDTVLPSGPMSKESVRQTESKVNHPMGKVRTGVGQRRGG